MCSYIQKCEPEARKNMTELRRFLRWCVLLNKRFLKKKSFVIILCLIPLLSFALRRGTEGDSSILRILIVQTDPRDSLSEQIVYGLSRKKVVSYEQVESAERAEQLLISGKADEVWIFPEHFGDKLQTALQGGSMDTEDCHIEVIQREDNIYLQLARTQLYGEIYPAICYEIYADYMRNIPAKDSVLSESELRSYYENNMVDTPLFTFSYMDAAGGAQASDFNYLLTPVRKFLSLWLILCGFAAALFWMTDEKNGTFAWVPENRKILLALTYHFIVVADAAAVALVAFRLAGLWSGLVREIGMMLCYVCAIVLFSNLLRILCRSRRVFSAVIVLLLIGMMVCCPILVVVPGTYVAGHLFPPYYYIQGIHNNGFLIREVVYVVVLMVINIAMQIASLDISTKNV